MQKVKDFIKQLPNVDSALDSGVYPLSINKVNNDWVFMVQKEERLIVATGSLIKLFEGEEFSYADTSFIIAPLNHNNANALRSILPFTAPIRVLRKDRSFGLGDRLGIATIGHLRLFKEYDAYPVFAQQSIRELNLTERTYEDVLDCVTFNVFEEGYKKGYGADGDHLKKASEIEYALRLGYTMITLDCSEHIDNSILLLSKKEVIEKARLSNVLIERYLDKEFNIEGNIIKFNHEDLCRCQLVYGKAIEFATNIFHKYFSDEKTDFEISIDETSTPTTPQQHFFVANELILNKVDLATLAPRFCGEFQKGVDYIGDISQFEKELSIHAAISRHFGYKLSIHSGSDKFSTFALIGKYTKGKFHVKTAGTSWLEAMKVVAKCDYSLYREIHKYALSTFEEAKKYYHVTTNISNIPNLNDLKDEELVELFNNNDARQLIHITYGFILTAKDDEGKYIYKNRLYSLWNKEKEEYAISLEKHIGRHLQLLYSGFGGKNEI